MQLEPLCHGGMVPAHCYLLSNSLSLIVQGLLFVLTLACLHIKKIREDRRSRRSNQEQRAWRDFFVDNSKQVLGFGLLHILNISGAELINDRLEFGDECQLYWLEIVTGTTFGTLIAYLFLRLFTIALRFGLGESLARDFRCGDYSDVSMMTDFSKLRYAKQLSLWLCVVLLAKLLNQLLIVLFAGPLRMFAAMVFAPLVMDPASKQVIVMLVTPALLNPFQFWITDSYLRKKRVAGPSRFSRTDSRPSRFSQTDSRPSRFSRTDSTRHDIELASVSAQSRDEEQERTPCLSSSFSSMPRAARASSLPAPHVPHLISNDEPSLPPISELPARHGVAGLLFRAVLRPIRVAATWIESKADIPEPDVVLANLNDVPAHFWEFFSSASAPDIIDAFYGLMACTRLAKEDQGEAFPYEAMRELDELKKPVPKRIWEILDKRVKHRTTTDALRGKKVSIVGAGPVGLRLALELALAGAIVNVFEKRQDFDRLNRMKLWDWVRKDLIDWGAKICFKGGSFGPGGSFGVDPAKCHIGIFELQKLLLKCCLLLGVQVNMDAKFKGVEWVEGRGWHTFANSTAFEHLDAVVYCGGASLAGSAELGAEVVRGDLAQEGKAIGIVANFEYNDENRDEKFKLKQFDWAYQFNVDLFKRLKSTTGADLENIVYFKGPETHYIVMTARKSCLLAKGCIKCAAPPPGERLLDEANKDMQNLRAFCQDVAAFFDIPTKFTDRFLEGHPQDVMIFDFSDTKRLARPVHFAQAEGATAGLPVFFAGDALLEPFWPTGLGCIRGFFSAFDCIASLQLWFATRDEDKVKAHNEETYRHLQTIVNPESKSKVLKPDENWSLNPASRYRYFN